jgi:hypothetical protein
MKRRPPRSWGWRDFELELKLKEFYWDWIEHLFLWGTFPIRHLRIWWYCRRWDFHVRFGLSKPPYRQPM